MDFLQSYTFTIKHKKGTITIKHKKGTNNKVANALSRRLLTVQEVKL